MAARFSTRQGEFLAFIDAYTRLHRRPPSEMEMAACFAISPPSAHAMVVTLEKHGLIERTPGQARSIRVLVSPEEIPALEGGQAGPRKGPAFEAAYPHLTEWVLGGGWIELGRTDCLRSLARALDEGGMMWEGKEDYQSMEELLRDLDDGIGRWIQADRWGP